MRFSKGLFDSLFGEKVELELPDKKGNLIRRKITKKYFDQMLNEGKISIAEESITVNILHPIKGLINESWEIGKDIDNELVNKFKDKTTNSLYAFTVFEDGNLKTALLKKEKWEEMKRELDII